MLGYMGFATAEQSKPPAPPSVQQQEDLEEQEEIREDVNKLLATLLPWSVSTLFHVGLVLLAIFIVWSVQTAINEEEVIVPDARLSATPGAPLTQQVKTQLKSSASSARSVTRATTQTTSAVSSAVATNSELIGVMGGAVGAGNPFGAGISQGTGFKASFYGTGGNARRLVYLVDASGSLIDTLPFVLQELKRSVSELVEQQQFTVIFFQEDRAIEVPPPGLKKADSQIKERVIQWIDARAGNVVARGQSNPLPALQLALRYRPQLLFILSDNITGSGRYEVDQKRLLAEIQRANTSGTKINTIQFLYPDPLAAAGLMGTLETISRETGGIYKFVAGRELNLE